MNFQQSENSNSLDRSFLKELNAMTASTEENYTKQRYINNKSNVNVKKAFQNIERRNEANTDFENQFYESRKRTCAMEKPWMNYVNKYAILTNAQRDSLDLYFINNQIKINRKNIRTIASDLKISYKKVVNYIYEKNYDHLLVNDGEEQGIGDLRRITREIERQWKIYGTMAVYFRKEMGLDEL